MTDPTPSSSDPLPLRMLNEYAYCPRLFHFMHVEGRWADNEFTVEGRHAHRRVDSAEQLLPTAVSQVKPQAASQPAVSGVEPKPVGAGEEPGDRSQETGENARLTTDNVQPTTDNPQPPTDNSQLATGNSFPGNDDPPPTIVRSVPLSSQILGLSAKLDLVSAEGVAAVPVETKRGRVPENAERSWEPERVQLMGQGLLLREHGYQCDHGMLYFAGSRTRVRIDFTPELEARTRELLLLARAAAGATVLPPPLEDSPKCNGCSLAGICLPDETNALLAVPAEEGAETPADGRAARRLYPVRDDATPFYVQEPGAYVGCSKKRIIVKKSGEELASVRLQDLSQLVLCGNVQISTQAVQVLCEAAVPIVYLSMGHWFYGISHGIHLRNAYDRAAQFRVAGEPQSCLHFARRIVADKAENQRTLLRRNAPAEAATERALRDMDDLAERIGAADSLATLLGIEGAIAAAYFGRFSTLLKPRDFDAQWDFASRNRRPPRDPVNALLSFGYAMLAKECTVALLSEGLDPWWGLYHQPRHGRPALALDVMEPFRPAVVDSAVISAINTGMVQQSSFETASSGCILRPEGRKAFIRAYDARLDQLITHPIFDYRCSWRVVIRLQARLLARWLRGEIPSYTSITTR
ncbi:MAG TPA: CRISPR-associated endonuclease Cas1 [Humisphaera sp.]|jgi:CRISPR-associated protein Cas1|nr:CRISPR-associated endonuclease Cas1 [Humisphaera sp.]